MILTDYYKFEKLPNNKSKMRFDCVLSTQSYIPFEVSKNKKDQLFIYIGDNTHTKAGKDGKSDLSLTDRTGGHISSVFAPDVNLSLWFGDVFNTTDALLFICDNKGYVNGGFEIGTTIEVFVARGKRDCRRKLFELLKDGELAEDIEQLRRQGQLKSNDYGQGEQRFL